MGSIKVGILEKDSIDLEQIEEMDLLSALNYIEFSGLPYEHIPSGVNVLIPSGRQMPVYQSLHIEGSLSVEGKVIINV